MPPWRRCPQARWPEAEPMAGERSTRATRDRRPTAEGVRASLTATPLASSPRKAPQEQSRPGAWRATCTYSLRLPRGSPRSDHGSVRSAHSGGAALVLHQLPCSQHPRVRHPGLLRPDNSWCTLPPSPGPCKSNCAAGAVRDVHTPSGESPWPVGFRGPPAALSHIWTTRCVQGLFVRDSHQGLDGMHIFGLSMER